MKKIASLFLLILSAAYMVAQTEVTPYTPGRSADAITYYLPKTVIEMEIEATHITYTPGEFSKYAERYLRLTGISDKEDSYWEISKTTVTSTGIPDPDHAYSIKLKDKTVAPLVDLTEEGILKAINKPFEQPRAASKPEEAPQPKARLNARDFMTEEILLASSSAKMAELVAKEIYNIRESKNALLRGQADYMPQDGAALKLMLTRMEEQEQAMMEMFTGTTDKEIRTFKVRMIPTKNVDKDVLFRFSRKLGIVAQDDLSGSPVYFSLADLTAAPETEDKASRKNAKIDGVVYNVPGMAQVRIYSSNKTFFEGSFPIAQFGNQETLSNALFNKKNTTQVTFDTTTGAVIRIEQ